LAICILKILKNFFIEKILVSIKLAI